MIQFSSVYFIAANVCRINKDEKTFVSKQCNLQPHQSSVLHANREIDEAVFKVGAEWLVYGEKCSISGRTMIRNSSLIPSINLILFCKSATMHCQFDGICILIINDWIKVSLDENDARLILNLQSRFSNLFSTFLKQMKINDDENSLLVLDTVISIIEDDAIEKNIKINRSKILSENQ